MKILHNDGSATYVDSLKIRVGDRTYFLSEGKQYWWRVPKGWLSVFPLEPGIIIEPHDDRVDVCSTGQPSIIPIEELEWEKYRQRVESQDAGNCTCFAHPVWVNRGTQDSHFETQIEPNPCCPVHGAVDLGIEE